MTWTCLLRITRRSSRVKVTVAERSMRVSTLVALLWKLIAFDYWSLLGCGAVLLDEWLWDVVLCCWMSGCGMWRCVVGWVVVGCGAVLLDEWLWDVALCCWMSGCGMWHCVVEWVVSNIFKTHSAFIFSVIRPKKVKTLPSFEMSEAAGSTTEWHIKEIWHIQYCVCFSKYSRTPRIGTLVIWISLTLGVNMLRILQNYLALKLLVIGSSIVQCYGF